MEEEEFQLVAQECAYGNTEQNSGYTLDYGTALPRYNSLGALCLTYMHHASTCVCDGMWFHF